jgi:hypothetical protein
MLPNYTNNMQNTTQKMEWSATKSSNEKYFQVNIFKRMDDDENEIIIKMLINFNSKLNFH